MKRRPVGISIIISYDLTQSMIVSTGPLIVSTGPLIIPTGLGIGVLTRVMSRNTKTTIDTITIVLRCTVRATRATIQFFFTSL